MASDEWVGEEDTEDVFAKLVGWELLGDQAVDPRILLRSVSFGHLCKVMSTITEEGRPRSKRFVSEVFVEVELMYRKGQLKDDWKFSRSDECVLLEYQPTSATQAICVSFNLECIGAIR